MYLIISGSINLIVTNIPSTQIEIRLKQLLKRNRKRKRKKKREKERENKEINKWNTNLILIKKIE